MKLPKLCLLALALTLFGAACQNAANTNTAKPEPPKNPAPPAASAPDLSTPTKAALAFYEAVRKKDVDKIKLTLSKDTLAQAKEQSPNDPNKPIMASVESAPPPASLDIKNEKITGDTATIEVAGLNEKDRSKTETFYFAKEPDGWKVDLFHQEKGDKMEKKGSTPKPN